MPRRRRRRGGGGGPPGDGSQLPQASHQPDDNRRGPGDQAPPALEPATTPPVPSVPPSVTAVSTSAVSSLSRGAEHLSLSETKSEAVAPGPSSAIVPALVPPLPSRYKLPARPGFGKDGEKCLVWANHFLVGISNKNLCHYDVAISDEKTTSRKLNRLILSELVKLNKSSLGGLTPAYDGRKNLYTAGELPFISKDFVVKIDQRDQMGNGREKEYQVTIKLAAKADLHHLQEFLQSWREDAPQDTIQALDVVLRQSPSTNYTAVGRSFFSPQFSGPHENTDLGGGLEYWRGFYQSLRPTQMGLSLNIDIAATSFYKGARLMDFIHKVLNHNNISRPLGDVEKIRLKKALKGVTVETSHIEGRKIRYKINGISSVPMKNLTFPIEDGSSITVVQHFMTKYGLDLVYKEWPCLLAGNTSRPKYIPMEVCEIISGQRYANKLSEDQVRRILTATCKRPLDRAADIMEVVNRNSYSNDDLAKQFGMRIHDRMVCVNARVLPTPVLKYHDSGEKTSCTPTLGKWSLMGMKMVRGGTVQNWTCLNFSEAWLHNVTKFCGNLVDICNQKGMVFNARPCITPRDAEPRNLKDELVKLHKLASRILPNGQLDLLIIILHEKSALYGKIKKVCETELGIVSQCCLGRYVVKYNWQYLENVSLKINAKVGGSNTFLDRAAMYPEGKIPYLTDMTTIIFGADVTHPAPGEDSSPSIAAVVASMDWPDVTRYRGVVSAQSRREEIIKNLAGMVKELLLAFHSSTEMKPDRIIFYRDGVSEGQFSHVLFEEVHQIRQACLSFQENYLPPVTFIVVQKRHHTRLFPQVHRPRGSSEYTGNILPGTVVDTKICHPIQFDFYLCSHAGRQGTSRPAHYHVLYDENNFTADGLQRLTNDLCYTYVRCTSSVSVVPPAYYAHLAAFRARYYLEDGRSDASTSLSERSGENPVEIQVLPDIKENVKDVMFYC